MMIKDHNPTRIYKYEGTNVNLRSEEHTSELQSQSNLVCRLLLEKKKHTSELPSQSNLVCPLLLEKIKTLASALTLYLLAAALRHLNSTLSHALSVSSLVFRFSGSLARVSRSRRIAFVCYLSSRDAADGMMTRDMGVKLTAVCFL